MFVIYINSFKVYLYSTSFSNRIACKRIEANVYGNLKDGGKLVFKGNWMSSQRGLPGSVIYYNTDSKERLWDEAGFV